MRYTDGKGSPDLWRKWAGIFAVAAACERKVGLRTAKGVLYPNMYGVLVGNAGVGKSLATNAVHDFLSELSGEHKGLHLAPTSVTKASLIDALAAAERRIVQPTKEPPVFSFNSLTVVPNELGVFLPAYDAEFMNALTDLWDCKHYSETRRTSKINLSIPNVQLNLFSATTPSYLNSFLPEGAWEQGFMSRVILIYAGQSEHTDLFAMFDHDERLYNELVHDLKRINQMVGELTVSEDVKEAINEWAKSGGQPAPTHPKLTHYCARRAAHLLKLCIVAAVASDEEYTVSLDHYVEALDWLAEVEHAMPDIFKAMKTGGDSRVIDEAWHFVYETHIREKKNPVLEHRVFHFLQERTPAHNVSRVMEVMVKSGLLREVIVAGAGKGFEPIGRNR